MVKIRENLRLIDLIDINLLQQLQDFFAQALDVASITMDDKGAITKPSNYNEFCKFNIKNRPPGDIECDLHNPKWGKIAANKNEPLIFKCRTGITGFVAPIIIKNKHMGSIVCGQIFTEPPNEDAFRKLAKKLNTDEDKYIQKLRKVKIISVEHVESAANLLMQFTNAMSEIGEKNLELIEKTKREDLYRNMVETIRSTLDIEETLSIISREIAKLFDIQRVSILEVPNRERLDRLYLRKEYKTKEIIKSSHEVKGYDKIGEFVAKEILKSNKPFVVDDLEESECPDFFRTFYIDIGVKSVVWLPIMSEEQLWGFVSLSKTDKYTWENEDILLLEAATSQLYMAINQSEIYEEEKKTAQREELLRKTIETIRSKFDPEEIKKYFIQITRDYFDADRCLFDDFDKETNKFLPFRLEILKSSKILSLVGFSVENDFPEFALKLKNGHEVIIKDVEKTLSRKNILGYKAIQTLQNSGVKSDYGLLVKYNKQIFGILIIHFTIKKKILTHDELDFLKVLRDQVGIALYQADLYSTTKQQAEKEKLLRKIFETIRQSLDINVIKNTIVNQVGKALNADRCFITEYDKKTDKFLIVQTEYKYSDEIEGYKGSDVNKDVPEFAELLKKGKSLLINNKEIYIHKNHLREFDIEKETINRYKVNSVYAVPIFYQKEFLGVLSIHYVKNKHYISKDEIKLMNVTANQAAIAFHQAKLYNKITQITANQNAILNNMPFMAWLKDEEGQLLAVNKAFAKMCNTTVENIIGKTDLDFFPQDQAELYRNEDKLVMETKSTISSVDLISESGGEATWHETFKSPVFDILGNIIGTVGISMDITDRKEDELELLRRQKEIIKANERERLLRTILQTMRNSLDINLIKKTIVDEIGQAANADICFIMNYETDDDFFVIDQSSEYRSSTKEKSFIDFDTKDKKVKFFIDIFKNKEEIIFENVEKYIAENSLYGTLEEAFLKDYNIKSSYNIPIFYTDRLYGYILIQYTNQYRVLDDEDLLFMRTIANQAGIALNQAELYNITKQQVEREGLLRTISETIMNTLDIEEVKNRLVNIVGKAFDADRCFIVEYDKETDRYLLATNEYLSSDNIIGYKGTDTNKDIPNFATNLKKGHPLIINNKKIYQHTTDNNFELEDKAIKKYNVYSAFAYPLYFEDEYLGIIAAHYIKKHYIDEDEIDLVKIIANQISVALHQAKLYKLTQLQAEREKISRKLIEILRSSLDKYAIKHLFVQNIGRFFNADRVFFSEYDEQKNIYLPVDKHSEYLSSLNEKSFIGYDWTDESIKEYTQPLLEKREVIIPCWAEYIKEHHRNSAYIALFEDANVKSSYNFPVLYQEKIVGYFCIEFTKGQCKNLENEDINIIRDMCIQAGIALFHAELYVNAKESAESKEIFIVNISSEIQNLLNKIIQIPMEISKPDFNYDDQAKFLDIINRNIKQLTDLKNNIINISEIESENFSLHYERIESNILIMDILKPLIHIADEKNIVLDNDIIKVNIYADRKRLTQILYNLLINIIRITPEHGHIILKSELENHKLIISIINSGEGLEFDAQNKIFETLKQIDSSATIKRISTELGLSIAKRLIELHNGQVYVDSTEDKGTKIWFTMPDVAV